MHQCHQHNNKTRQKRLCRFGVIALIGMATMLSAQAKKPATMTIEPLIKQFLLKQANGLPGKVNIAVNMPTAAFPACISEMNAFLPSGARAWGRISVGVRCQKSEAQAEWTRYIPAHVAVISNYVVTIRAIAAGETLSAADVSIKEGDLTALPRNIVTDMAQISGMVTRNRLAQGTPIRQELVKSIVIIKQGQTVKVLSQGPGFIASTEGRAMSNGSVGAKLQVKGQNGKMFHGIVQVDGTVELAS